MEDYQEWTLVDGYEDCKRLLDKRTRGGELIYASIVALDKIGESIFLVKRLALLTEAEIMVCESTNRAAGRRAALTAEYLTRKMNERFGTNEELPEEIIDLVTDQSSDEPQ